MSALAGRDSALSLVLGMMLRLSNSFFMQWRGYQRRPDHVTTTDFQSAIIRELSPRNEGQRKVRLLVKLSRRRARMAPRVLPCAGANFAKLG